MQRDRIGRWNCVRGFGFIHDEDSDKTYFVHLSRIQADGRPARRQVEVQARVEFEVGTHNGRPCAVNVRIIPREETALAPV